MLVAGVILVALATTVTNPRGHFVCGVFWAEGDTSILEKKSLSSHQLNTAGFFSFHSHFSWL